MILNLFFLKVKIKKVIINIGDTKWSKKEQNKDKLFNFQNQLSSKSNFETLSINIPTQKIRAVIVMYIVKLRLFSLYVLFLNLIT
ncbi:hypothetical protein SHM_02740 [Spiroplasma ixodetis]|uniref:Transmembrane protein n=1 Tax=Spiroplasma ixodetis TaxID=2141 RepID=A0ABM8BSE7_9MOLU|nr:hypothetical protein SHM_02740 [Spiroplasma ixodetis]